MTDIVANRIFYVHESEKEAVGDSFKFTASDGFNNVSYPLFLSVLVSSLLLKTYPITNENVTSLEIFLGHPVVPGEVHSG